MIAMRIAGGEVVGRSTPGRGRAQDFPFSDQRAPYGQRLMRFEPGDPVERRPDTQEIGFPMREVAARLSFVRTPGIAADGEVWLRGHSRWIGVSPCATHRTEHDAVDVYSGNTRTIDRSHRIAA
jgi:hypothetical protein